MRDTNVNRRTRGGGRSLTTAMETTTYRVGKQGEEGNYTFTVMVIIYVDLFMSPVSGNEW